jgi:hypothetical protein
MSIISAGIASTKASADRLSSALVNVLSSQCGWFLLRLKTALLRFFLVIVFFGLGTVSFWV